VYLGEHYATDIIVGVVYATLAYATTRAIASRRPAPHGSETHEESVVGNVSDRLPA
jgi:membrane-associated phospholipid phosphatase